MPFEKVLYDFLNLIQPKSTKSPKILARFRGIRQILEIFAVMELKIMPFF